MISARATRKNVTGESGAYAPPMEVLLKSLFATCLAAAGLIAAQSAQGAELKVLAAEVVEPAVAEIAAQFEKSTGNTLKIEYGFGVQQNTRAGFDMSWLLSLFTTAMQPDVVLLLDLDPKLAWQRRRSFKETELGRWDGFLSDAEEAFCRYQNAIRQVLLRMAEEREWLLISQTPSDTPFQVADRIEQAVLQRLSVK